jgi:hypothetical protein
MSRSKSRAELGTPPAEARRGARRGMAAWLGGAAVLTLGSSLFARFFPPVEGVFLLAFVGLIVAPLAPMLCQEQRGLLLRHGPQQTLLSAVTPTGPRTVDLGAITGVRGLFLPGKFGKTLDLLIVTDAHGVRIGLRSPQARAAVREALERTATGTPGSPVKVGRNGRRRLSHEFSVVRDFLVPLVLMMVWLVVGGLLCLAVARA